MNNTTIAELNEKVDQLNSRIEVLEDVLREILQNGNVSIGIFEQDRLIEKLPSIYEQS